MQALLPTDTPAATLPVPPATSSSQALGSDELQRFGDWLRLAYGPVEVSFPARLAELVEQLARREQAED